MSGTKDKEEKMNFADTDVKAFSEVKCILDYLPINYKEKVPKKLLDLINSLYDESYKIDINPNIELKKQNFSEDTKNFIAVLKYNYWCKSDEEKENLAKMFKQNEDSYQEYLKEKYNVDNIFKSRESEGKVSTELPVVIKKENLFVKVINFIKSFFRNK